MLVTNGRPTDDAARAAAGSPSGWAMESTPTGASASGAGHVTPRISRSIVRSETSRSIRGTIRQRSKASRLARTVASVPAAPST